VPITAYSAQHIFRSDWDAVLADETQKPYFKALIDQVRAEYAQYIVYPAKRHVFRALRTTAYADTSVVILGQDPYHGEGQAEGLSFSVGRDIKIPPSLRNIFQELQSDIGAPIPPHGSLIAWAEQGVLLLNAILTVKAHAAGSHRGIGWETFTDAVIAKLNERREPLVFILWGEYAKSKGALIDRSRHHVLASAHPSPFSAHRGFFGSRPFSQANVYLQAHGRQPIDWTIRA
jgi:uracil-DNA glycosylase